MQGVGEDMRPQPEDLRGSLAGHAGCSTRVMDPDLRYERPVKWLLAAGAAINWIAAMLVLLNNREGEFVGRYAGDIVAWLPRYLG